MKGEGVCVCVCVNNQNNKTAKTNLFIEFTEHWLK